ncbi:ribokinase [Stackebrandtia nassauensis]|uniref:Ribokinase n=1 Tax=Stackebrandtia nassauensis (strain DSM 44728 / CIP 108903 / NRRL B-16338 / NBRC 102104 / LLR-40K-21) TaxID=446470 RepID=D3Q3E4_STANL|nr:ribokinase [Stackebrandtia nassauensis]ADD41985.1 PfkB domain protein [Stackebrandtia nassauensis DSM 44728]
MSVVVLGSANLDLVYDVDRIPAPGETVLSRSFESFPGGKGLNQAIAAARSGAEVHFLVALGKDAAGDRLAAEARDAGIDLRDRRVDAPTGTAVIYVDRDGENSIVVNSGANATLVDLTEAEVAAIAAANLLVLQMETPPTTVRAAARVAKANGTTVILNAAPSGSVPAALLGEVDILIVNEHEAADLAGQTADAPDQSLSALTTHGCAVIVTLGAAGSLVGAPGQPTAKIPAITVTPIDTTGAGDAFVGAFAAALDNSGRATNPDLRTLIGATEFATTAAGIAVQRKGAVPSIPTLEEVRLHSAQS